MKKLIESALPLSRMYAETLHEKKLASGHPANLHLWWGRSPVSSVRSALAASLVDAPESGEELTARLSRVLSGEYTEFGKKPTVLDPFCGFGGIPLAAEALGLPAFAGDVNPVAVMLTKAATEIPMKFSGRRPAHPSALDKRYDGTEGLAEDVRYYGNLLREKAWEKLKDIYPSEEEGMPSAWIWVRTAPCPNPACGCRMPLAGSFLLYSVGGEEIWAEPVVSDKNIRFEIRSGHCPHEARSNKIGNVGAVFRCPFCGALTTDAYVKQQGQAHEIGAQMMAVVLETKEGARYIAPTDRQLSAADVPIPEDIPPGEMLQDCPVFSPAGYGFRNFTDLFSPRQLTLLTTLCDLLPEIQDRAASDALVAGMDPAGGSLASGGTGALAYGQAIGVYLAFIVDKLADSNSSCCTWRERRRSYRPTFGRQIVPMAWTYAEGNPFFGTTRNFSFAVKSVADSIRKLSPHANISVSLQDARTASFPNGCLVCTELPYYRKILYGDLSDYFYIWLRKSLKHVYPDLFDVLVTKKDELSAFRRDKEKSAAEYDRLYEEQIRDLLIRLSSCADREFPQLFFFEFHKGDEAALSRESVNSLTPWETIIGSMIHAGYEIRAVWPMRTALASEKTDGVRVLIVARVSDKSEQTTRRGFAAALKREFPETFERMLSAGVDEWDRIIVGIGAGLGIFTRYAHVLNASGSEMKVHDALELIYQEIVLYLKSRAEIGEENIVESEEE